MDKYKITIKIYGVKSRMHMINATASKLSISRENIFLDDRANGGDALYTAKKAYLSEHGDATHGIFLQDDIEVCDGFLDICYQIVQTHPDKIISLFPFDYQNKINDFESLSTPYIKAFTLSACGIIIPVKYIEGCFKWIYEVYHDNIADDTGIKAWANAHKIDIITTIPSLIQHIGDDSIISPKCPIRRTVYYEKNPIADWSNLEIRNFAGNSNFAPKCKNIIKIGGILNGN